MKNILILIIFFIIIFSELFALEHETDALFARVIDVGAGLCVVIVMPDGSYMIYDAGNYIGGGSETFESIKEIIPESSVIELMVLSHSDADHIGAVDEICDSYTVKRVLRSGYQRSTGTWDNANTAIRLEKENEDCIDINLRYFEYPVGATYRFGDTYVTMVCGFHKPPEEWNITSTAEERNAGSIVVRVIANGKSILLCGDTVGRHIGDPNNTCIAAEKFMVENSDVIKIDSDVIIAPHHGADNANSTKFIEAVSPEYVIFSAGHKYNHPRQSSADRYISTGVNEDKMYRTDFGDNEGGTEWSKDAANFSDPIGDDDVDILITSDGTLKVEYRN